MVLRCAQMVLVTQCDARALIARSLSGRLRLGLCIGTVTISEPTADNKSVRGLGALLILQWLLCLHSETDVVKIC